MEKAERNEVGFYMPQGFSSGDYRMNYSYRIYPDIKYDGAHYLLTISFKDNGNSYHHMIIRIEDAGNIEEVRAPAIFNIHHSGRYWYIELYDRWGVNADAYVIMNSLGKNMSHNRILRVDNVYSDINWNSTLDAIGFYGLYIPYMVLLWILYLFPAFIIIAYFLYGREKKAYGVEKGRITPPFRRKPWIVNLVFKKEGGGIDMDGFLSTLLDLKRQGKIEFKDGKIVVIDKNTDDPYEKRVLDFLDNFRKDGGFDPVYFKNLLKRADYRNPEYNRAKDAISDLRTAGEKEEESVTKKFLWIPRKAMMRMLPVPILIILLELPFAIIASRYVIFYMLILMYSLAFMGDVWASFSHPSLLGKWKNDYYREKLEWDSFAEVLGSKELSANISEHSSLWEDWLIYGTALGVGDKVKKAMKEAGISIDMLEFYDSTYGNMIFIYVGGPSSGGGVGGGGFGGGGGGAR